MSISKTNILELQFSLRQAVVNCSERCQYQSAKWAAELLDALPDDDLGPEETSVTEVFDTQTDPAEARLERDELPKFLMAKALLDCHEPRRCAAVYLSTNSSEHTLPLRNNVLNISHSKLPGSVFRKTTQRIIPCIICSPTRRRKRENRGGGPHPRAFRYWCCN